MTFTRRETALLIAGDFLLLIASLWAALLVRNFAWPAPSYFDANLIPFLPVFVLSIIVFYVFGLYEKQTRLVKREMGERIFGAQVANVILAALIFFALPLTIAPKTILAIYLVVSVIFVSAWRFYRASRERVADGVTKAVLVAAGPAATELFEEVNGNNRYLFSFSAHLSPERESPESLQDAIARDVAGGARIIVIDSRDKVVAAALPLLYDTMIAGIPFLEFAAFYEDVFDRVPLAHVDHAWLLECLPKRHALYDIGKRAFDLMAGIIASVIALPFIGVAAVLLRLSGGSAFITNERVGKGGKQFKLVKLRTMLYNDHGDPELRAKNRVTALGKILRKSRVDELPQLWNVLLGDLSFIGPRPELPSLVAVYEREIPYYGVRHLIQPGLSGWAQIRDADAPKGGADVVRTRAKLSYDLYYLKHRSFGLDLAIAAKTIRALASFSGK